MKHPEEYGRVRKDRASPAPRTLRRWADAYISLREALGFKTVEIRKVLRGLFAFMHERHLTSFDQLDRGSAASWLNSGAVQETTVGIRLTTIRGFFRYLLSLGTVRENVWDSFSSPKRKRFIPHIFSIAELRIILGQVWRMIDPRKLRCLHLKHAYHTMYHTTYACGLRACEVCGLKIGDVDFGLSLFTVRNTKFWKTRLVPFNSRTRELVTEYLDYFRPAIDGKATDAPLFLNLWRRAFRAGVIGAHFRRVCIAARVYRPKRIEGNTVYGGTTIHALRHSFAVHRLLKWYEDGVDVNAKLPLLATYMGHAHYQDTQRYLRVLPIFIDIAKKLFAENFENSLKDLERCPKGPGDP
jgi:site-specific recombinase XerD